MLIFSHRGNGLGAPENSLEAFRRVAASSVCGVELDVRLTSDGIPIILHDPVFRLKGKFVKIGEVPYREPGFPLPTLYDACAVLLPTHKIIVEIKPGILDPTPIVDILNTFKDAQDQLWVSSFDPEILARLKKKLPALRRTLLVDSHLTPKEIARLARTLKVEGIHLDLNQLESLPVRKWKQEGYKIRAYTLNTLAEAKRALCFGADDLMSDDPLRLSRYLKGSGRKGFVVR